MKIKVVDLTNAEVGEMDLEESIFGVEVREHLFWEVVRWQRAKRRAGTHKAKGRTEVSGGGKKPWRQKGTGRARQGSTRASQFVGGGKAHGPSPRDYSFRLSRKKRQAALRCALAKKFNEGQLRVVDALSFERPKTKAAVAAKSALDAGRKALFVDTTTHPINEQTGKPDHKPLHNDNLRLSVRNMPDAKYIAVEGLNVEDLLGHDTLIISREAVEQIHERLGQ
jgi:large subunit ribosomal protein L4